jgi:acyl CoA:acetate/3-ketoacid CoA transferase alpha subunit/acyl CoA:acetate/3-ketoacid CoA transferase beta subunit
MEDALQRILREIIPLRPSEGQSKVMPLTQALRKYVEPGLTLHLGVACIPPSAIIYELTRLFQGRDPRFTLVALGLTTLYSLWVHAGLLQKVITTFMGDTYPSPGPNPIFQKALREDKIKVEHWSLLSLVQRLKAGAMGLGFLPTRSILGSNMELDNREDFSVLEDPFGKSGRVGLLRSLNPDLSFYHGLVADSQGNTLFAPPYAENLYGALASKRGVIVTVEKIVSTDFLRAHSGHVRLPGYRVLSVSEVPFGGHPSGCSAHGVAGIQGYSVDNPFVLELRKACKRKETLDLWMDEWVSACSDQPAYLKKLGEERLTILKERSHPDSWHEELETVRPQIREDESANAMERMVIVATREIISRVKQNHYRTLLAGIGASNLAAWLATYLLRQEGYEIDVMAEIGFFGYLPRPADPFIFNLSNIPTCKMLSDVSEVLGLLMSGENQSCLGALSAAQVDRFGNLNSTIVPPNLLITGSGGANDVASGASEVLVVVPHSSLRFVAQVPYITAPGHRVKTLVSTLGLFEKIYDQREFSLTGVIQDGKSTPDETIRSIKAQCGWDLKVAPSLRTIGLPTAEEMALLRLFDPQKFFLSEST